MSSGATRLRVAEGDELTQLLLERPARELPGVLDNPNLDESHLLLMLRRSDLGSPLLRRVAERPEWATSYQVKAALVTNAQTPKVIAMNFVKFLFWRDLAKVIHRLDLPAAVRRLAEVTLRDRLNEISLGEKVTLARMAPREAIKALRHEQHERIIAALLDNPRTTEEDVLALSNRVKTPQPILALIARSARWNVRYNVRLALLRNPRTPAAVALPLLVGLVERDLLGLVETPNVPGVIRNAAERVLRERKGAARGRSSGPTAV